MQQQVVFVQVARKNGLLHCCQEFRPSRTTLEEGQKNPNHPNNTQPLCHADQKTAAPIQKIQPRQLSEQMQRMHHHAHRNKNQNEGQHNTDNIDTHIRQITGNIFLQITWRTTSRIRSHFLFMSRIITVIHQGNYIVSAKI